jgi:hypothetical protein
MRWIVALLVLIACGVSVIVFVALPLPNIKLGGCFLLTIGALHLLFYKKIGLRFFASTQSMPLCFDKLWARGGERGTQHLFLGIGIILAMAGCVLVIFGSV